MALTGVCALLYSILTCFIGACIIPLSYGFFLNSDGIRYCFSHSINPLFCWFLFAFSQYQLARACVRLITTRRDAEYYRRIEWEYYQMIDCFGWCCRCWACALTVQNICHKFTFIWPNAADHPPPPSPPGYVLPMPLPRLQSNGFCANAGVAVAVDAVAAACGLRRLGLPLPLFMWFCLRSVWTKSLTDQTSASYKCRGEERKRERQR